MAMTELYYDRERLEREGGREDRRNEETKKERTMVWIRVKRDRKKGRWWGGKTWQRWELYRPRRTAGLYPLSSLYPHHLALWNERYTSRWRTVEEYPRYISPSRSTSKFLPRFSSSPSLCPSSFFPPSFFVFLSLLSLFFLSTPSHTYVKVRSFSLSFLYRSTFFSIRLFSILLIKGKEERKGRMEEERDRGSKGAVARKACIRGGVKLWGVRIGYYIGFFRQYCYLVSFVHHSQILGFSTSLSPLLLRNTVSNKLLKTARLFVDTFLLYAKNYIFLSKYIRAEKLPINCIGTWNGKNNSFVKIVPRLISPLSLSRLTRPVPTPGQ